MQQTNAAVALGTDQAGPAAEAPEVGEPASTGEPGGSNGAAAPVGETAAVRQPDPAPEATDAHASTPPGPEPERSQRRAALSPSRAKDFLQCPLLFRLRTIDRLPEPPSLAATKGTLVHAVLERLFDLPAGRRTEAAAHDLLDPRWEALKAERPEVLELFTGPKDLGAWLEQARSLLTMYFRLENPQRLEPAEREALVEVEIASGVLLRGFVDRMDVAPDGAVRIVDYKTGKAPHPRYQDGALFQMRFYALMLWRLHGVVPRRLQLVYLGNGRTLTHDPAQAELEAFEAELDALWERIGATARSGDFRPRTSRLCDWCSFKAYCPSFGGTPPELPVEGVERLLEVRATAGTARAGTS